MSAKHKDIKVTLIDAADLALHPQLSSLAIVADTAKYFATNHHGDEQRKGWAEELSASWQALVESIREHGVLEPLRVLLEDAENGKYLIVDGRHRFRAGLEAGLTQFPCRVEEEDDAGVLVFRNLFNRNHFADSARAYAAVVLHPAVLDTPRGRPTKRVDSIFGLIPSGIVTAESLAKTAGVSADMITRAKDIFRAFEKSETLRARLEPSIWAGASLGAIMAGIAGATATAGAPRAASNPHSVERVFGTLRRQLLDFESWDVAARESFETSARELAAAIPAGAVEILRSALVA